MLADLTQIVARYESQVAHDIATMVARSFQCQGEFLTALESVWAKDGRDHDARDRVWLAALAQLSADTREYLYGFAYRSRLYAAARCIAYHRPPHAESGS